MQRTFVFLYILASSYCFGQDTLRIVNHNLLNYNTSTSRDQYYRTILRHVKPDILVVQEMTSSTAADQYYNNVVNLVFPGQFAKAPFNLGFGDTGNDMYYRTSKVTFVANFGIRTALRDINEFKIVHSTSAETLRVYSVHLKASTGFESNRAAEVDSLRKVTNALPFGKAFMVMGDFNIYTSTEPAYQKLLQNNITDDGRFVDTIHMTGTWNNSSYAPFHTQSPRVRSFGGGATGGMDDRFDMILFSRAIASGTGRISYVASSMTPIGNDGLHYNDSINRLPNNAVPDSVANALHYASDHLPVSAKFVFRAITSVQREAYLTEFKLYQNYPNPFNPSTTISFSIPRSGFVTLKIFDVLGREIAMLQSGLVEAGMHEVRWNASGLGSGVYFVCVSGNGLLDTRRMVLLR